MGNKNSDAMMRQIAEAMERQKMREQEQAQKKQDDSKKEDEQ